MRKETVNIYQFNELSDTAKEKAIESFHGVNIDHEWYDCTYEDAERIGLKISGFNIGRGNCIEGTFSEYTEDVAKLILNEHGKETDTYILSRDFLTTWESMTVENQESIEGEALEVEFERAIKEEYLSMLRNSFEYLTSEEAITESIIANECEFLESGEVY